MSDRFDPSAFIAAEQESQPVAGGSEPFFSWDDQPKTAENRQFQQPTPRPVATIAAVAGRGTEFPWSAGLVALEAMSCPPGVDPIAWDELVNEAAMVSKYWGARAIECGWTLLDLFGCNSNPLARRLDRDGLVVGLAGFAVPLKIVGMNVSAATLETPGGDRLRHHRMCRLGQVPLWEAYRMLSGP